MLLTVSVQAEAFGAKPPMPAASTEIRVLDPAGELIHTRTLVFTQPFPFDFGPLQVAVGAAPIEVGSVEVRVRGQFGEDQPVLWFGRVGGTTIQPGSEASVSLTLYPGPHSNLGLTGISVSGGSGPIGIGESHGLGAQGQGGTAAGWFWGSLDPAIASISPSGQVTGHTAGTARIVVAAGMRADTLNLQVRELVETVTVTPSPVGMASITEQLQLGAEARDFRGDLVTNLPVTWSSSDTSVVTVDASGRAWARGNGTAQVTASVGGASGSTSVTVDQVPDRMQVVPAQLSLLPGATASLDVIVRDALGSRIVGIPAQLTSNDPEVAAVEGALTVRGGEVGSTTLTVEAAGMTEEVSVVVVGGAPGQLNLISGGGQSGAAGTELAGMIRVRVLDESGFPIPNLPVSWTTADGGEVTQGGDQPTDVEGRAEVRWRLGPAPGPQTLTATVAGLALHVPATAVAGPPAQLSTDSAPTLFEEIGEQRTYTATVQDAFGNPAAGTVTWSFESGGVLAVSNAPGTRGRVTALANGSDNLIVTLGALADTLTLTVDAEEVLENGSFEIDAVNGSTTIPGWSVYQEGSGSWSLNSGTILPLSGFDWPMPTDNPGPTHGSFYVVADQSGPALLVLYQDVTIPAEGGTLRFDLALYNWHGNEIVHPSTPFDLGVANQHFRMDLIGPGAAILDTGSGVLAEVYHTVDGPTPVRTNGFIPVSYDLSALAGQTVRLRFAMIDNAFYYSVAIDNVRIEAPTPP
jgi:hypothetical protein